MNLPDGLINGQWTVLAWCLFAVPNFRANGPDTRFARITH
jgi:hypothetical protein